MHICATRLYACSVVRCIGHRQNQTAAAKRLYKWAITTDNFSHLMKIKRQAYGEFLPHEIVWNTTSQNEHVGYVHVGAAVMVPFFSPFCIVELSISVSVLHFINLLGIPCPEIASPLLFGVSSTVLLPLPVSKKMGFHKERLRETGDRRGLSFISLKANLLADSPFILFKTLSERWWNEWPSFFTIRDCSSVLSNCCNFRLRICSFVQLD